MASKEAVMVHLHPAERLHCITVGRESENLPTWQDPKKGLHYLAVCHPAR